MAAKEDILFPEYLWRESACFLLKDILQPGILIFYSIHAIDTNLK